MGLGLLGTKEPFGVYLASQGILESMGWEVFRQPFQLRSRTFFWLPGLDVPVPPKMRSYSSRYFREAT